MKKAARIISEVIIAAAFALALCTVGASDAMDITHSRFIVQILISMVAMVLGYVGMKVTE